LPLALCPYNSTDGSDPSGSNVGSHVAPNTGAGVRQNVSPQRLLPQVVERPQRRQLSTGTERRPRPDEAGPDLCGGSSAQSGAQVRARCLDPRSARPRPPVDAQPRRIVQRSLVRRREAPAEIPRADRPRALFSGGARLRDREHPFGSSLSTLH
jgi:hypothetical protein